MKSLYLFIALLLSQLTWAQSGVLGNPPTNLRLGFSTPSNYTQSLTQLVWTPGGGSKFVGLIRWVRPGAAPLLVPVDGQTYGHGNSTSDMSTGSYVGAGTYAFIRGEVDPSGSGMVAQLRNLYIGHIYEIKVYEYDSIPGTGAIIYRPTNAQLTFTAARMPAGLSARFDLVLHNTPYLTGSCRAQYLCTGFQIQQSIDSLNFTNVDALINGGDSVTFNYRFVRLLSNNPIYRRTYYRLLMSHRDGTVQYSNVVVLNPVPPLPVELVSFTGKVLAVNTAHLEWKTASERNASYFEVQRSTNGLTYRGVGRQTAAGTSSMARAYEFEDPTPLAELTYYRLLQVDTDGNTHYSLPIKLQPTLGAFRILMSPNPAQLSGQVPVLHCTGAAGNLLKVALIDLSGRQLLQQQLLVNASSLDVPVELPAGLPPGVYLVHVTTAAGQVWQGRLALDR